MGEAEGRREERGKDRGRGKVTRGEERRGREGERIRRKEGGDTIRK